MWHDQNEREYRSFLQEELKAAQELLDESETLHAEVHGTLTNNLLKKKGELEGQISGLATPENRYLPFLQAVCSRLSCPHLSALPSSQMPRTFADASWTFT